MKQNGQPHGNDSYYTIDGSSPAFMMDRFYCRDRTTQRCVMKDIEQMSNAEATVVRKTKHFASVAESFEVQREDFKRTPASLYSFIFRAVNWLPK